MISPSIQTHQESDSLGTTDLSIVLIGPDDFRRKGIVSALAGAHAGSIQEVFLYPQLDDVPQLLQPNYDVVIVDIDSDPEMALDLVECICGQSSTTVMVYSAHSDSEMLVRCMRAGAREFLTQPIAPATMTEALVRASARRQATNPVKKTRGKMLVFLGAKGGSGVTTLACNFAVSLAQESKQNTLFIDLDLPLGDAALNLGISSEYSTFNALQNHGRLDANFLSKLLVKHSSGLWVLGAPGKFVTSQTAHEAIDKLLTVARNEYEYIVVDAGTRLDLTATALFDRSSTVYLVTQVSIPELRNSNRLITEFFKGDGPKLEIVLNRHMPRSMGMDDQHITKALTKPVTWRIPNDYATAKRTQNTATPLSLEDSPISRVIKQMARATSGLPENPEKKNRFRLFGAKA
jgi:pilus assembly protein CpaE